MTLVVIAALGRNRVIGRDGSLPWRLPADLRRFKRFTTGHALIMGRRTLESLGRPLPNRRTVVLSRRPGYAPAGVEVAGSLDAALALLADAPLVFVCGGVSVYAEAIRRADELHLTVVDASPEGDVLFPEFDWGGWAVAESEACAADARHAHGHTWYRLVRPAPGATPASRRLLTG